MSKKNGNKKVDNQYIKIGSKFCIVIVIVFILSALFLGVSAGNWWEKTITIPQRKQVTIRIIQEVDNKTITIEEIDSVLEEIEKDKVEKLFYINDNSIIKLKPIQEQLEEDKQKINQWVYVYNKYLLNEDYKSIIWLNNYNNDLVVKNKEDLKKEKEKIKNMINNHSYDIKRIEEKLKITNELKKVSQVVW